MKKIIHSALLVAALFSASVSAQEAEVRITLDEQFFEALLEAVFKNLNEPKVPLSKNGSGKSDVDSRSAYVLSGSPGPGVIKSASYTQQPGNRPWFGSATSNSVCDESVRLKREVDGVRTAVRFRNGRIYAPIAFDGNYNPPLIGCFGFSGWAETDISLVFDKSQNSLVGKAKVHNVKLSGTNGIGSGIVTRLVQNAIDRKVNPIKIMDLNQLSFTAPIQDAGKLRMEAVGFRHIVGDRQLDLYIKYEFKKAPAG